MESTSKQSLRPARKRKAAVSYIEHDEDDHKEDLQSPAKKPRKGKKNETSADFTVVEESSQKPEIKKKARGSNDAPLGEKRLRRHRARAPDSYLGIKNRALSQRLTVLSRERCVSDDLPGEKIVIAGSTGNVYTVNVGLIPRCNCPHAQKGNQCKHIIYIMLRVLKAREDVAYQLALTGTELCELIKNAPLIPGIETHGNDKPRDEHDGNRKPIEGECPICYDELNPEKDEIIYCKTSCGNNVHKTCMQSWIQVAARGKATCPYCRATWDTAEAFDGNLANIDTKTLQRNEDGYLNVASELGLSGERDYSTYHQFWVRRQFGRRW